jgi:hypothetical protein
MKAAARASRSDILKLIDYAYRSQHEMTAAAKAILAAFYGKAQTHSYWSGCSGGETRAEGSKDVPE